MRHAKALNYTLTATSVLPGLSDFEIEYSDNNGDNMLGYPTYDTIIHFSDVTYRNRIGQSFYYDTLDIVPTFAPYLKGPGAPNQEQPGVWWRFSLSITPQNLYGRNVHWEYNQVSTPVPEPGTLILLGISVMSVVGLKRWWKA